MYNVVYTFDGITYTHRMVLYVNSSKEAKERVKRDLISEGVDITGIKFTKARKSRRGLG